VNPDLPEVAVEFGRAAASAFASLGGVDAALAAEGDPAIRSDKVLHALEALGLDDIDPRSGDDEALASAAVLCVQAGRVALPYPVAAALLRDGGGVPFAVVPDRTCRVDHGDLFDTWRVATLDGRVRAASRAGDRLASRLGPFVTDLDAGDDLADDPVAVALFLTLSAAQVLGTAERAVELAAEHVSTRIQFGKPIATFQAVQFMLADAHVAVAGLRELLHFTLWRHLVAPDAAMPDVLGLRLHALDVARPVLRVTQQLHGASGVCDEYAISVLARHVQPALRLPASAERTAAALADAIDRLGFDGLFEHGRATG
jgi:hypothetical protein